MGVYEDRLYGLLELIDVEEALLETPEFERLKDIGIYGLPTGLLPSNCLNGQKPPSLYEHVVGVAQLARRVGKQPSFVESAGKLPYIAYMHQVLAPPFFTVAEHLSKNEGLSRFQALKGRKIEKVLKSAGLELDDLARYLKKDSIIGQVFYGPFNLPDLDKPLRWQVVLNECKQYNPLALAGTFRQEGSQLAWKGKSLGQLPAWQRVREEVGNQFFDPEMLSRQAILRRALEMQYEEGFPDGFFELHDSSAIDSIAETGMPEVQDLMQRLIHQEPLEEINLGGVQNKARLEEVHGDWTKLYSLEETLVQRLRRSVNRNLERSELAMLVAKEDAHKPIPLDRMHPPRKGKARQRFKRMIGRSSKNKHKLYVYGSRRIQEHPEVVVNFLRDVALLE
ncbi:MAG: hypothetical protein ACE5DM_05335 [Candidatus Nanoarchaeia archaeon]